MQNSDQSHTSSIVLSALLHSWETKPIVSPSIDISHIGEKDTVLNRIKRQSDLPQLQVKCFEEIIYDNPRLGLNQRREIDCKRKEPQGPLCERKVQITFEGKDEKMEKSIMVECPENIKKKKPLCVIL